MHIDPLQPPVFIGTYAPVRSVVALAFGAGFLIALHGFSTSNNYFLFAGGTVAVVAQLGLLVAYWHRPPVVRIEPDVLVVGQERFPLESLLVGPIETRTVALIPMKGFAVTSFEGTNIARQLAFVSPMWPQFAEMHRLLSEVTRDAEAASRKAARNAALFRVAQPAGRI